MNEILNKRVNCRYLLVTPLSYSLSVSFPRLVPLHSWRCPWTSDLLASISCVLRLQAAVATGMHHYAWFLQGYAFMLGLCTMPGKHSAIWLPLNIFSWCLNLLPLAGKLSITCQWWRTESAPLRMGLRNASIRPSMFWHNAWFSFSKALWEWKITSEDLSADT